MSKRRSKGRNKARMPTISRSAKVTNTGYSETGASYKKGSLAGWRPVRSSPQSDIDANLSTLRARSASLTMGTPIASSAVNNSRTNVIGAGLRVSPRPKYGLLGMTAEEAETWAKHTKEEFDLWAASPFADICKRNNFYDMQDIAYMCYLIDGDSFAAIKYRRPEVYMPYGLRLQLVEGARICNPGVTGIVGAISPWTITIHNPDNGNRIINGVEVDDDGAVTAYWICNRYPYDPANMSMAPEWQRVDAFGLRSGMPNILQICHDERPEQYRGVPYLAPVIEVIKQVGRYSDAELTSAIIKSFFSVFFEEQTATTNGGFPIPTGNPNQTRVKFDPNAVYLGPGSMNVLPPGYKATSMDPGRSLSTFEPFTKELIKQIGAAIEQPYEVLMKAFNSSYTASRAALLQAWSNFKMRRVWFSRDFCQPVYEAWLTEAVASGRITAPRFFDDPLIRKAWCNSEWYGPVMGVLDPVKEVTGAAMRVAYGFSTREKEAAEMTGTSWDENVERLATEQRTMKNLGIEIPSVTKTQDNEKNKTEDSEEGKKNAEETE